MTFSALLSAVTIITKKKINKDLKKQFVITYNYYKSNINKFILMLQKDIYPYEYMDNWEKVSKTSSPKNEDFCSSLSMKDITD